MIDLGRLTQGRLGVWKWLILPPAVAAGFYFSSAIFDARVEVARDRVLMLKDVVPVADRAVTDGETVLRGLSGASGNLDDAKAQLSVEINRAADENGFRVTSLSFDENVREAAGLRFTRAVVKGYGEMHVVTGFLYDLSKTQELLLPDRTEIRLERVQPSVRYTVRLEFKFGALKPAVLKGGA